MPASPAPAPAAPANAVSQPSPNSAAKPASPASSGRPAWQRNPVFRFFSSVKLAIVLLSVIIVASAAGTIYESSFDAKVARAYVYEARWFNLWLLILGANLACSALSRWPWKRHHTGFLVTHLGIIVLLVGAWIGRTWGIEGSMTLFKGQPPNNQLLIDQHVVRVEENGQSLRLMPVSIIGRRPTAQKPWTLGVTPAGWKIELTEYAPVLAADFAPVAAGTPGAGRPAVHVKLTSKRLNQNIDGWLLVDDAEHNALDLGLASVQVRRGTAPATPATSPAPTATGAAPAASPAPVSASSPAAPAANNDGNTVDETIVAFSLKPGDQVTQPAPNTVPSGLKIRLEATAAQRRVFVDWRGATWDFDADADHGKAQDLSGSGLTITIENYWPDFVMKDGQPTSASAQGNNPAVLVRVRGKLPGATTDADADPAAAVVNAATPANASPGGPDNQALIYCDDNGALTFTLKSSATPDLIRGELRPGQPINTGWADWQLNAAEVIPNATAQTNFRPLPENGADNKGPGLAAGNHTEGVKVRLSRGAESYEEWAAQGWNVTFPTKGQVTQVSYGFRVEALPIGLQLTNFDVERDEGNDNPAGFKSTLLATDLEGRNYTGSCSMNQPFNVPGAVWNTFSGLTYKMSQASWNPDNLNQSTVQILRDPGWLFKWVGSLLIVSGIFTLFYLRPAPKLATAAKTTTATRAEVPGAAMAPATTATPNAQPTQQAPQATTPTNRNGGSGGKQNNGGNGNGNRQGGRSSSKRRRRQ